MVQQLFGNEMLKDFRLGAIGVKLGFETGLADAFQQGWEGPMDGGFSACDAEAVDPILKAFYPLQNTIQVKCFYGIGLQHKLVVVTIRTPEVAVGQKDDRANVSGPVEERRFDESFNGRKIVCGHEKFSEICSALKIRGFAKSPL